MSATKVEFLGEFIKQSEEGNLKTSSYPKEFADLKMKVPFGMGMPARVPWISSVDVFLYEVNFNLKEYTK